MNDLTGAQVWYVCKVYPETITRDEAQVLFDRDILDETDRSYWEAAASALNKIARGTIQGA